MEEKKKRKQAYHYEHVLTIEHLRFSILIFLVGIGLCVGMYYSWDALVRCGNTCELGSCEFATIIGTAVWGICNVAISIIGIVMVLGPIIFTDDLPRVRVKGKE